MGWVKIALKVGGKVGLKVGGKVAAGLAFGVVGAVLVDVADIGGDLLVGNYWGAGVGVLCLACDVGTAGGFSTVKNVIQVVDGAKTATEGVKAGMVVVQETAKEATNQAAKSALKEFTNTGGKVILENVVGGCSKELAKASMQAIPTATSETFKELSKEALKATASETTKQAAKVTFVESAANIAKALL